MAAGNFLSALIQRGVQAGAGALQGKKEGRDRLAGEARQAEEDALQRAVIEARMATERRQQTALDREAADFVPRAVRVAEEEKRLQDARAHQIALERLRGQNARATAGVRGSTRTGGRSDPRVGVLNSRINRLRTDATANEKAATDPFRRMRDPAGATADSALGAARRDSIGTFETERDRIVGMGDDAGSEEILGTGTEEPAGKPLTPEEYDYLVKPSAQGGAGLSRQQIEENGYTIPPGR